MNPSFNLRNTNSETSGRFPLAIEQRLSVLQQLQGHLKIEALLNVFSIALEKQIDITRLIWDINGVSHIVRSGNAGAFHHTFTLKHAASSLGMLQYGTPYPLDADEINLIHAYHRLLIGPLQNAIEYRRVRDLALTDGLTGLNNRIRFEQDLNHAISLTKRNNQGLILMIFDMDNFKQVNDNYGHLEGDRVLRQFSTLLRNAIRTSDSAYRIGGDEFAVILSPATGGSAQWVNQRLNTLKTQAPLLQTYQITRSAGCAVYRSGDNITTMFERADHRMYHNKNARRRQRKF